MNHRQAMRQLVAGWRKRAKTHAKQSATTWRKLRDGVLPQEDGLIYSVYSDEAASEALNSCAAELERVLSRASAADLEPVASAFGALGGLVKSPAKAAAARANGRKGGRPPKAK